MEVETRSNQQLGNPKTNRVLIAAFAREFIWNYSTTARKEDQ